MALTIPTQKHLSIKAERKADGYDITIAHQTHKDGEFGDKEIETDYTIGATYKATNGVRLTSANIPEWRGDAEHSTANTLFVRGSTKAEDDSTLSVSLEDGRKIMDAVREYNKDYWAPFAVAGKYTDWCVEGKTPTQGLADGFLKMSFHEMPFPGIDYGFGTEGWPPNKWFIDTEKTIGVTPDAYKTSILGGFSSVVPNIPTPDAISWQKSLEEATQRAAEEKRLEEAKMYDKKYFCISTMTTNMSGLVRIHVTHMSHFGKKFGPKGAAWQSSNGVILTSGYKQLEFHKGTHLLNFHIFGKQKHLDHATEKTPLNLNCNYIVVNSADADRIKEAVLEYNTQFGYGPGVYCTEGRLPIGSLTSYSPSDRVKIVAVPDTSGSVTKEEIEELHGELTKLEDDIRREIVFIDSPKEDEMDEETVPSAAKRLGPLASVWAGLKNLGAVAAVVAILGGGIMGLNAWNASDQADGAAKCLKTVYEGQVIFANEGNPAHSRLSYGYDKGPRFTMTTEDGVALPAAECWGRTCEAGHFHPINPTKKNAIGDGSDF